MGGEQRETVVELACMSNANQHSSKQRLLLRPTAQQTSLLTASESVVSSSKVVGRPSASSRAAGVSSPAYVSRVVSGEMMSLAEQEVGRGAAKGK